MKDPQCLFCERQLYNHKRKFCSRKCVADYKISKRSKLDCQSCGKEFFVNKYKTLNNRRKFCSKACRHIGQKELVRGERSGRWKGGRFKNDGGYYMILAKEHPYANALGYVREHRLIMEKYLGRYLLPHEVIDHINGIKVDNRLENLRIVTASQNTKYWWQKRKGKGFRHTEETKRKMALSKKGKRMSEETKKKISETLKRIKGK